MNWQTRVLSIVLLLLLAVAPTGCAVIQQVVQKPTVQVQSVSFQSQGLREGRLDSQLHIYNPNGFTLPVRSLTYRLRINGHELAHGKLSFDKQIPAHGALVLNLPVHFQYQQVLSGIESILRQHQVDYQLGGEIDLGLSQIPYSKSGQLALRF
jgi:LEA14-like dessication related protein